MADLTCPLVGGECWLYTDLFILSDQVVLCQQLCRDEMWRRGGPGDTPLAPGDEGANDVR